MKLCLTGHDYRYECEKICRIFYPTQDYEITPEPPTGDADFILAAITEDGDNTVFFCDCRISGKTGSGSERRASAEAASDDVREKLLARAMLAALTSVTGYTPPWGILTGVRPSKLMMKYIGEKGAEEADAVFRDFLLVSPEKTRLAHTVADAERECVALSRRNSFSVYVSVPFCPSRCSYCSFVSHSIAQAKKLIPDYVRLLTEEIRLGGELAKAAGLRPETVYVGGGTPTSLSAEDLETVCAALGDAFGAASAREFTVEAGRPDTVTKEKLLVLKRAGVGRISINPQTFSDEVLARIGRRHTSAEIYEKYALARDVGFDSINMDLIAGLPGDTPEGFRDSLERALELSPENITVHTLALKTASALVTEHGVNTVALQTSQMLADADALLTAAGYSPYYMYRQSKSVGNLENVGWTRPGRECLYNIYMMEEVHTVMAFGAGAVTRTVDPDSGQIERIYNFKYPYEYISRFSELTRRKSAMTLPV